MESAIVLFLSPTRKGAMEKYVGNIPGRGEVAVFGAETNDAPCKFLLQLAAANRDRIGTVLCLLSRQVTETDETGESAYTRFGKMIDEFLTETDDPDLQALYKDRLPKIVAIPYDFDPDKENAEVAVSDRSNFIYRQIAGCIPQYQFRQLYIDYTGGFRDAGFLLTELSRFLNFVDIPCRHIVYSNYGDKQILSLQSAYEMFPILSGIHNFINTGNAIGLQKAYQTHGNPLVDDLLRNMTKFARAVSVCAIGEIDDIWSGMDRSIQALEQYSPTADTDVTVLMLRDFLPKIRKKLKLNPGSSAPPYLSLIRWCLDNEMLQQAMTLFTERIAEICFEKELFTEELLEQSALKRGQKAAKNLHWVSGRYYALHTYLYLQIASEPDLGEFARYSKTLVRNIYKNKRMDRAVEWTNNLDWSQTTLKASRKLTDFIKSNFDSRNLSVLQPQTPVYNKVLGDYGKDLNAFVDAMVSEESHLALDYFVHNDYKRFCIRCELRKSSPRLCALEVLNGNTLDLSEYTRLNCRQLKDLLQHCYVVKVLRNQMNHAGEDEWQDYQYFISQGVFDAKATLYEVAREALGNALDFFDMLIL